jgi:hypothetical protein
MEGKTTLYPKKLTAPELLKNLSTILNQKNSVRMLPPYFIYEPF